jgi:hypothetical protein
VWAPDSAVAQVTTTTTVPATTATTAAPVTGECGDPALPLAERTGCKTAEDVSGMRVEALAGLGLLLAGVFYRCGAAGGGGGT